MFLLNSRHSLFSETMSTPYSEGTGSICRVPSTSLLPSLSSIRLVYMCLIWYGKKTKVFPGMGLYNQKNINFDCIKG